MHTTGFRAVLILSGLTLAALLMTAPALHADDKAAEADRKAMNGLWVSKDEQGESTWLFKGDHLTLKTPTRAYECAVTLDPDAKPEKSVDFKALDDSPNAKGAMAAGIYKFDGAKLLICFNGPDGERPREFKNDFPKALLFELSKKK
ncbi:MAG: TIGR03067 domain-containing protein [Isosphaeraceae bacterium]